MSETRALVRTDVTTEDHQFAATVAEEAGALLQSIRAKLERGLPADELRVEGDARSHGMITAAIGDRYPDDAWLSEEAPADPARLSAGRVWIIDPLDGTREFGEHDRVDWAVHVALVIEGTPVVGAVSLPAQGITLTAQKPPLLPSRSGNRIRIAVSRTRPTDLVVSLADRLQGELVPMGSAGAKIAAVAQGVVDVYAHSGGQYEWDSAAPVAVARAAGLHASRLDGSELRYNQNDPWLPDLVVCRRELAASVLAELAVGRNLMTFRSG